MKIISGILLFISLCSFLLAQQSSDPQKTVAGKFVNTALREQQGYLWLQQLCAIGSRLSGSKESLQAIRWAQKVMQNYGADHVWLQQVMVPNWKRGTVEKLTISRSSIYRGKKLIIAALGGSIGTAVNGITSSVLEVKSLTEVDSLGPLVEGKIVFFNRPFDREKLNPNEAYGGAVDQRSRGAARAGKAGAVAVLVRSVTSKYDNAPHTGVTYYEKDGIRIPAAAIGQIDADFLSSALQQDPALKVTLRLSCKPAADTISYNVIGEITGSEFPQEIIVVGAHIDSWDLGYGAHDDGGGCVQAMEVLNLFKKCDIKSKRTIRCVLFMDEEQQQTGAAAYASWSDSSRQNHVAVIESDRGVLTPRGFTIDTDSLTLAKICGWQSILDLCGIDWVRKGGSGADVGKLKQARARIGYVPDSQRYFDFHHSANDILAAVHPRELELGTAAMATLVYLLSQNGL